MVINSLNIIEIVWHGPYRVDQKDSSLTDKNGLYQIYGTHPVNGPNNLLYIGKTENSFSYRLSQHWEDWIKFEPNELEIYIGSLNEVNFSANLDISEKLLIYYCSPPYNSNSIYEFIDKSSENGDHTIVLNLFRKNLLPYEVSILWYHPNTWDDKENPQNYQLNVNKS